jgi:acyl dehydratase
MDLKSVIGTKTPPRSIVCEASLLRNFALATGAKDRIYWDENAATKAEHRALPAPPTFLFSLAMMAPEDGSTVWDNLDIDLGRILHGEEKFVYGAPVYAGDTITFQTEYVDAYEKKGGALKFIVSDTHATNQDGEFCGKTSTILVLR